MTPSPVDPLYSSGKYFEDPGRFAEDADFKVTQFLKLLSRWKGRAPVEVRSCIDVGCGSGDVAAKLAAGLREHGFSLDSVKGYDVSPHVSEIRRPGVRFVHADFSTSEEYADLVTLFDVVEHVPGPVEFLREVSARCALIGLHIPLDNNFNVALRNMFHAKLADPGHLLFLDTASALNLPALAGLRVIDYSYTFSFQAPSWRRSLAAKAAYPLRALAARISPWLLSKTLGGASLMVLALTPRGLRARPCTDSNV